MHKLSCFLKSLGFLGSYDCESFQLLLSYYCKWRLWLFDLPRLFLCVGVESPSHAIRADADPLARSATSVVITLADKYTYDCPVKILIYPSGRSQSNSSFLHISSAILWIDLFQLCRASSTAFSDVTLIIRSVERWFTASLCVRVPHQEMLSNCIAYIVLCGCATAGPFLPLELSSLSAILTYMCGPVVSPRQEWATASLTQ